MDPAELAEIARLKAEAAAAAAADFAKNITGAEAPAAAVSESIAGMPTKLNAASAGMKSFGDYALKAAGFFGDLSKTTDRFAKKLAQGLDSAGGFMMAKGYDKLVKSIDASTGAITDIQAPLLETRRTALEIGQGFGQGFTEARKHAGDFHKAMSESQVNTRSLRAEVMSVQKALGTAFRPDEMNANLTSLGSANKNFQSALNNTNAALLVSKATGIDAGTAAGMLAEAHLRLGESAESAPKIFGQIALAAKNSGLQYSEVSKSIMKSAGDLKMWGGTVGSVTPVFNAFARTLKEGQKGLAPELAEQYVAGLNKMSFAKRAFIGMKAPGGAGKSAIGAGLQQEMLMEKGESGMAEMSANLISAIKGVSGGKMITRQEAVDNPQLENNFQIQRELLKSMIGGTDASANKMIDALKVVDESGMAVGEDSAKELHGLMKTGQEAADATTNAQTDATILLQSTVQSQGERMLSVAEEILSSIPGAGKAKNQLKRIARGEVGATGAISGFVKDMGVEGAFKNVMGNITKQGANVSSKSEMEDVKKGMTSGIGAVNEVFANLANMRQATTERSDGGFSKLSGKGSEMARSKIAMGQDIATKKVMPELKEAAKKLTDSIKELSKKEDKTAADRAKIATMEEGKDRLNAAMKKKKINLAEFGAATETPEEKPKDEKSKRDAFILKQYKLWQSKKKAEIDAGAAGEIPMPGLEPIPKNAKEKQAMLTGKKSAADDLFNSNFPANTERNLPIAEAQAATTTIKNKKEGTAADPGSGIIERTIRFTLLANQDTVTVKLDEEKFNEKVIEVLQSHPEL